MSPAKQSTMEEYSLLSILGVVTTLILPVPVSRGNLKRSWSLVSGPYVMGIAIPLQSCQGLEVGDGHEYGTEAGGEAVTFVRLSTLVGILDSSILAAVRAADGTADSRAPSASTWVETPHWWTVAGPRHLQGWLLGTARQFDEHRLLASLHSQSCSRLVDAGWGFHLTSGRGILRNRVLLSSSMCHTPSLNQMCKKDWKLWNATQKSLLTAVLCWALVELQSQKLGDGPLSTRVPERNAK